MKIIGIDPGLSGAIAVLENNKVLNIFDMPVMSEGKKNKRQLNSALLVTLIKENIKNSEEEIFEIATDIGAKDCQNLKNYYEIISEKEDFYKVKSELEKKFDSFDYSNIEWRPLNFLILNKEQNIKILDIFESLEELDDVQNIYTNVNLKSIEL